MLKLKLHRLKPDGIPRLDSALCGGDDFEMIGSLTFSLVWR